MKNAVRAFFGVLFVLIITGINVQAQEVTGQDTLHRIDYQWEFYDFTAGTAFSISDTATYDADIRGSSNEGVNFGKEFSAAVLDDRIMRLSESGDIDTVSSVPSYTGSSPWVSTSWETTNYQPITPGELWVVYTREGLYVVIEIVSLPDGNFGNSLVFKYKYMSEGGTSFPNAGTVADQVTGSTTVSSGTGFDFSREEVGDNADAGDYQLDFAFVSNEGVNFGNEGSSSLSATGRRFLLLGTGNIDTVSTVPERTDSDPWKVVSYDATGYQPISVGQLWAVYTREGHYAVMEITDLPGGDFGSSFSFDYKYQPNGTNSFDATETEEPSSPEIQTSGVVVEEGFTFTNVNASSKTAATATYTVTGLNLEGDIELEAIALEGTYPGFDLSLNGTVFSGDVTISQSDASDKQVTVRAIVPANNGRTYEGKIVHSTTNGDTVEIPVSVTELYEVASITLEGPSVDSTIFVGDSVSINWTVSNLINESLTIEYSLDEFNWTELDSKSSGLGSYTFDTSELPAGTYYVRISAEELPTPVSSNTISISIENEPQEQSEGTITISNGAGFDFSTGSLGDNEDETGYELDFAFVSNEGVNFGNESSSSLSSTGRRFYLMGTGKVDSVTSVPERTDAEPWKVVSYDATGYQPISVGQLWAVYTREGDYAVMEITDLPGGNFGSSFTFKYKYQPNGTRFFDGTEVEEEEPDPVYTLSVLSGNNQTVGLEKITPESLFVKLVDQDDLAVTGEEVQFEFTQVPSGAMNYGGITNGQTTNVNGEVGTSVKVGDVKGEYIVKASLVSDTTKKVFFTINGFTLKPPAAQLSAGAGFNKLYLIAADSAVSYNIYRSVGDDNPASSTFLDSTTSLTYSDYDVTSGQTYFYWLKSVDADGNESETSYGPLTGTPTDPPAQILGEATIGLNEGFEFSTDSVGGKEDAPGYIVDLVYVTNEGTNFGNEGSTSLNSTGRRFKLLGEGSIDTVTSVPQRTDASPWITVTWDWPDGTQGAPISVGQLWGVFTREGHYGVMEITHVNSGSNEFTFKYKYQPSGSRFFEETESEEPEPVYSLSIVSGNNQIVNEGSVSPELMVAKVTDDSSNAVSGQNVLFEFVSVPDSATGYGGLEGALLTGADGLAKTTAKVGNKPGDYVLKASLVSDTTKKVFFTLTVEVDTVYSLAIYNGNNQSVEVNTTTIDLLQAKVTDQFGNPISGQELKFEFVTVPDSATGFGDVVTGIITNTNGTAGINAKVGDRPGTYVLKASLVSDTTKSVTFTINATEPAEQSEGTITISNGEGFDFSTGSLGDNEDETGYMLDFAFVNNEGVNFGNEGSNSITETGRRFLLLGTGKVDSVSSVPERSDATPWIHTSYHGTGTNGLPISVGQLWAVYTREGHYAVMEITDLPGGGFGSSFSFKYKYQPNGTRNFDATEVEEPEPEPEYSLSIVSGNNQTVDKSGITPELMVAKVTDDSSNAVSGQSVLFEFVTVPDGASGYGGLEGALLTGADGLAKTTAKVGDKPGDYVLKASLVSDTTKKVFFTLTVEPKLPNSLIVISGNNQSALPGDTLNQFEVKVLDDAGNGLENIEVVFEVIVKPENANNDGLFSMDGITIPNVHSGTDGIAKMKYRLGDKPGDYTVKAYLADYAEVDSVIFSAKANKLPAPRNFVATGAPASVKLSWDSVQGAASYNLYRSQGDDNPATASLLSNVASHNYTDSQVGIDTVYYYWIKSVDAFGNEGEFSAGPVDAIPTEIPEPTPGEATIVARSGSGFSKDWDYFDFSKGYASTVADSGDYLADIRGTSNEGVNFGNEKATQIEGRRVIYLETGKLEDVKSIPEWTNEAPWINVTWDWPNGTSGQPVAVGQLWGVYTREGNYAVMEITDVPEAFGDSLSFRFKYQEGGSPIFEGEVGEEPVPDSLAIVSGDQQKGVPGSTLATPLKVQLFDSSGMAMKGVTIHFEITSTPDGSTGAAISAASVISSDSGYASVSLTLGDLEGDYLVNALVEGVDTVSFTATSEQLPPPDAVTMVEIRDGFQDSTLSPLWTMSKSETFLRYRVYMSIDGENYSLIDSTRRDGFAVDTARSISSLTPLEEYYFKVSVVNEDLQESELSNALSALVKPRPEQPQNVTALAGDGAVQLSWTANDTAYFDYYLIYSGLDGNEITPKDTLWGANNTSIQIDGLTNDETYQFYVLAVNDFGKESDWPDKVTATPVSAYEEEEFTIPVLINGTFTFADVDNDRDLDLLITGQKDISSDPEAYLLINDGSGDFSDSGEEIIGVVNSTVYWYDVDQNGYTDIVITGESISGSITKVYLNEEGSFTDAGFTLPGLGDGFISPADYDSDGDLDFLIAGDSGAGLQTILIKNNKSAGLEPVDTPFIGVKNAAASWGDYNADGRKDLFLTGEDENGDVVSKLYINKGSDNFSEQSTILPGVVYGAVSWLDFNLDRRQDLILVGYTSTALNELFIGIYTNTTSGMVAFYTTTIPLGAAKEMADAPLSIADEGEIADKHNTENIPDAALRQKVKTTVSGVLKGRVTVGDYDNDGDPDALVSAKGVASILKNNKGQVAEEKLDVGVDGTVVWADYDGDGDLDIVATGTAEDGSSKSKVFSNNTSFKNTPPTVPMNPVSEVVADTVKLSWDHSTDEQTPFLSLTYNVRIGSAKGASDVLSANADLTTGKLKIQADGNTGYDTSLKLQGLANGTYYWQVQAVDNGFLASKFTNEGEFTVTTSIISNEEIAEIPAEVELMQNYPNPFNPTTQIEFAVPKDAEVKLQVYDITGRLVGTLVEGRKTAGRHSVRFDARSLASGLYLYRIKIGSEVLIRKMTLIK